MDRLSRVGNADTQGSGGSAMTTRPIRFNYFIARLLLKIVHMVVDHDTAWIWIHHHHIEVCQDCGTVAPCYYYYDKLVCASCILASHDQYVLSACTMCRRECCDKCSVLINREMIVYIVGGDHVKEISTTQEKVLQAVEAGLRLLASHRMQCLRSVPETVEHLES